MLLASLLLASALPACPSAQDPAARAAFPAPRHSGAGRVPFAADGLQLLGWTTIADFPGGNVASNDCWGETSASGREYAVLGLSNGTAFVEVTDPGRPRVVAFEPGPASLWRGVKTYAHHAYAGSEGGGGVQVFDLTDIDAGRVALVDTVTGGGLSTATHTLALDEQAGFLYRAGGGSAQGLVIYDLAEPAHPTLAGQWHAQYVHEVLLAHWQRPGPYLGHEIAFCFLGAAGALKILDVTDKAAPSEIATVAYPGARFAHQGGLSAGQGELYLGDEFDDASFGGARTRLFDVRDLAAPSYLGFFSSGVPSIDHNLYVAGARLYESNFRSGLFVFDLTDPRAPVVLASFDTWPADDAQELSSLASCYPYFASGTLVGCDVEKGLFVWRAGAPELAFAFPDGLPTLVDPAGQRLRFEVVEDVPGRLAAGTVRLHVSTGGAFLELAGTPLGGSLYEAALPASACGAELAFYVSAESSAGRTWSEPPAAPTQVHLAHAAYARRVVRADDLERPSGWSAGMPGDTATLGQWTRVDPVGTGAQPEDDHGEAGSFCFVTGQGAVGGASGEADVDGGVTTLVSPSFDATGLVEPRIAYWRWFSNQLDLFHLDDTFRVALSGDGGATWVEVEAVGPGEPDALGGWIRHEVRIADFLAPTSSMRLRFRAEDVGGGSIVEAAVDDLELSECDCTPLTLSSLAPASGSFEGGDLVTLRGSGFVAGVTTVRFGSRLASALHVRSSTELVARVPRALGPVGGKTGRLERAVDVQASNPGSATLVRGYTYVLRAR